MGIHAPVGATVRRGTFTGTLTGYASGPTGTVEYTVEQFGVGRRITLYWPTITGTSNATSLTMTGLPAALSPTGTIYGSFSSGTVINNGGVTTEAQWSVNATTVTFYLGAGSATGFTSSGTKGLAPGQLSYLVET